jgi:NTE family protein
MLRALEEAGVVPDLVVGSSVGALNGVVVAADPIGAAGRLEEVWGGLTRADLFGGRGRVRMLWNYLRWRKSLCPPEALRSVIGAWLPVERFDELSVPMAAVVTDLVTGDAVLMTSGRLEPALLASAAIPGVYPPVELDGELYADGGITANVPVRQAITFGARSVVVLNANPARLPARVPTTIVGSMLRASLMMLRSQRADAVDGLAATFPVLHLPQITPPGLSSFDFEHTAGLIGAGHRRTSELLASIDQPHLAEP